VLEDRCLLSAGVLDPTFGSGAGYVTTSLSNNDDVARHALVQPSGNIVVAGTSIVPVTTTTKHKTTTTNELAFGVSTYNPDGSLDTAFGSGGIVRELFAATRRHPISGPPPWNRWAQLATTKSCWAARMQRRAAWP
jgi:hypothetical protein